MKLHARWEKDFSGKRVARRHDLSTMMDPTRRIAEARDLNNNLMRWRVATGLDLDIIKRGKVLVLGMGTLGCGVVRTLMVRPDRPFENCRLGMDVDNRDGEWNNSNWWITGSFRLVIPQDRVCIPLMTVSPAQPSKSTPPPLQCKKSIPQW